MIEMVRIITHALANEQEWAPLKEVSLMQSSIAIIKITMDVIPSKQLEMSQTLLSLIKSVENDQGCISYEIFHSIKDKNRFCILGLWTTHKKLELHILSHQFGVLFGTNALLTEPLDIQIFTASHTEGMDTVCSIRDKKLSKHPYENEDHTIK